MHMPACSALYMADAGTYLAEAHQHRLRISAATRPMCNACQCACCGGESRAIGQSLPPPRPKHVHLHLALCFARSSSQGQRALAVTGVHSGLGALYPIAWPAGRPHRSRCRLRSTISLLSMLLLNSPPLQVAWRHFRLGNRVQA